jgi:predicted amidophosphoribosyltransferase
MSATHAACPDYAGQWHHKGTGACSCGSSHAMSTTRYCPGCGAPHVFTVGNRGGLLWESRPEVRRHVCNVGRVSIVESVVVDTAS